MMTLARARTRLVLGLIGVAAMVGVTFAATIRYDIDHEAPFGQWRTLAWARPVSATASIAERRLARAIEAGFSGRGYALVADTAKADFLVDFDATAWRETKVTTMYSGPAFGRTARVDHDPRGALAIVVVNRATGRVAWHGVVAGGLAHDPQQADQRTAKAVEQLLRKFPARGGAR